ncbi:IS4 family transposase [mine drainage metagenome]|uniref:IS4 family transposase n=2 Tax=root TaxID=1 RepID=T1AK06_9ZZZZ
MRSGNHSVFGTAQQYLCGLMQAEKRNMERMVEAVPDSDYQVLQNFLTHSSWDYRPVMDRVAHNADALVGGEIGTGLYIDESAFAKKGDQSVGVARQWNGRLGKQDNCQVGVFGALGRRNRVALTDARLYLPKGWTDDPRRCERADVPRPEQIHRTKLQLAQEIVQHARELGVRFEWVGVDGGYGNSLEFLQSLQDQGETFLADIHSNRHIYLKDPVPYLPPQGLGPRRVHYHSEARPIEVRKWVKKQPASAWRRKTLRSTTKGELIVEVLHRKVWLWDKHSPTAHCWHLIVRREVGSPGTIKYSLSNAPAETSVIKLARMQAQRFWIERAFQDAKSHIGMAQYQARQWQSWHRHMALVMMAMLFMLQERLEHGNSHPLLSCYDIQILLATTLPDRRASQEEVMRQLHIRHQQRQALIHAASLTHGASP